MYKTFSRDNANVMIIFLPAHKQQDGHNCGLFAVAFAADILDIKSPIDVVFHIPQLRSYLAYCLESGALTAFQRSESKTLIKLQNYFTSSIPFWYMN